MKKKFIEDDNQLPLSFQHYTYKKDNHHQCNVIVDNHPNQNNYSAMILNKKKAFKYNHQEENYPLEIQSRENISNIGKNKGINNADLRFLDNNNSIQKVFLIVISDTNHTNTKDKKNNNNHLQHNSLLSYISSFNNLYFQRVINSNKLKETLIEIRNIINNQNNNLNINGIKILICINSLDVLNSKSTYLQFSFMFDVIYSIYVISNNYIMFPLKQGMNNLYFPKLAINKEKRINILPSFNNDNNSEVNITTKGLYDNLIESKIKEPLYNYLINPNEEDCVIYLEKGNSLISTQLESL